MNQFVRAFQPERLAEAWQIVQRDFPEALWETMYVTILSTFFAIVIGLPLGMILVAGEENGILPMPKYDEAQENYRSYVWSSSVCVPTTILRPELVGAALEQFAYESMPVTNAYIEDLIRGKSTRDTETLEMLDIIYGGAAFDFVTAFNFANAGNILREMVTGDQQNFVSV